MMNRIAEEKDTTMMKHILDNIPLYRAKKMYSNEWLEGYLLPNLKRYNNESFIVNEFTRAQGLTNDRKIDPATLAIHYPNMLASDSDRFLPNGEKDLRIFASLDETNGIGGDKLNIHLFTMELGENMGVAEGETELNATAIFNEYGIGLLNGVKKEFLFGYAGLHEESIKILTINKR